MKIIVDQRQLTKHINIAQKSISARTTLQILDGILLEAKNNKLKLTGTDLELSIETYLDCQIIEEGSIVVGSRIFGDIIKKLPDSPVEITSKNNNINIRCQNSEFNIAGNPGEEYPDLPLVLEKDSFTIPMDIFKGVIRQTVFATTQDETRPSLTGVLVELDNNTISFVALDGYRLAMKKIPMKTSIEAKMIIPGRSLTELNKILDDREEDVNISISSGNVVFTIGDTTVYSRLLEGQFFNYKDIIRTDHKTSVIVNKKDFQNSLERASLLAKEEKANLVKLSILDNQISIKSNTEIGNVHEVIDTQQDGENLNIAFNSRYILEGIKVMDLENIKLNFMGSLNPCIINGIEEDDYTYLVLPVRLAQDDF
ncbi:DNA polymerase III subunit beta [Wansuia hejianensis]|uniref:Beta sliding clamp n=1 Tax=Wansuia hejianensis TaxID=2763667 RepID=A0A926IMW9_9FIRM|nr:DNA polymerase III subunit beta [Wansuia hejianensis]MBC8590880.1 DNA polymerase III subunit beta [Wansuia hejianensis]